MVLHTFLDEFATAWKAKHLPTTPSVPGCFWSRLGHTPSQSAHPVTTPTCGVQHPLSVVSLQEVQSNEMGKDKLGDGTYLHSIRVTLIRNYTLCMSVADVVTPISHCGVKLSDATTLCHCKTKMVRNMWEGFVKVQRTVL